MAEANGSIICKHCKKQIKGKAKLIGLTIICPYCGRPSEDLHKKGESD
jgi:DNA-directed RNA polymerase subunit RPC12/RpoP